MTDGTTVVVATPSGEPSPPPAIEGVAIDGETGEVIEEAASAPASEAVAIAEIEANKEITIAAIHAETEQAAIEQREEGNELWREEMTSLREQVTSLSATVETLAGSVALLTLPPSLPPEPAAVETLEPAETISFETPPETSSETRTEAPDESGAESPAPRKRRHRAI